MPTTYCPSGHAISYTAAKPEKCPRCGVSLNVPSVAAIAAGIASLPDNLGGGDAAKGSAKSPVKQPWPASARGGKSAPVLPSESNGDLGDDLSFDASGISVVRASDEAIMTVAQLRERKDPVERRESGQTPASAGMENVSTGDLVSKMLADAGTSLEAVTGAPPPAQPAPGPASRPAVRSTKPARTSRRTSRTPRK